MLNIQRIFGSRRWFSVWEHHLGLKESQKSILSILPSTGKFKKLKDDFKREIEDKDHPATIWKFLCREDISRYSTINPSVSLVLPILTKEFPSLLSDQFFLDGGHSPPNFDEFGKLITTLDSSAFSIEIKTFLDEHLAKNFASIPPREALQFINSVKRSRTRELRLSSPPILLSCLTPTSNSPPYTIQHVMDNLRVTDLPHLMFFLLTQFMRSDEAIRSEINYPATMRWILERVAARFSKEVLQNPDISRDISYLRSAADVLQYIVKLPNFPRRPKLLHVFYNMTHQMGSVLNKEVINTNHTSLATIGSDILAVIHDIRVSSQRAAAMAARFATMSPHLPLHRLVTLTRDIIIIKAGSEKLEEVFSSVLSRYMNKSLMKPNIINPIVIGLKKDRSGNGVEKGTAAFRKLWEGELDRQMGWRIMTLAISVLGAAPIHINSEGKELLDEIEALFSAYLREEDENGEFLNILSNEEIAAIIPAYALTLWK